MDEPIPPRPRPAPGPPPEPGPIVTPNPGAGAAQPPPAPPAPADAPQSGISRRWLLAGGAAVLLGGGAGVGAEFVRHRAPRPLPTAPGALVAAAAAERALIADLTATTGGTSEVRAVLGQARANHAAHLAALDALLTAYRRPAAASPPPGTPRTRAQLRAAESAAATAAAERAATLGGAHAALLASIAACEATHAELFR